MRLICFILIIVLCCPHRLFAAPPTSQESWREEIKQLREEVKQLREKALSFEKTIKVTPSGVTVMGTITQKTPTLAWGHYQNRPTVIRYGLFSFAQEPSDCAKNDKNKNDCSYERGKEHAHKWVHIKTPDKARSSQMYTYRLRCHMYGTAGLVDVTYSGYMYAGAPTNKPIHQGYVLNNITGHNVALKYPVYATQYVKDNHLHLAFGPINRYGANCTLDFRSGSTGEVYPHLPKDYSAHTTERLQTPHPVTQIGSPPKQGEIPQEISKIYARMKSLISLVKEILKRL